MAAGDTVEPCAYCKRPLRCSVRARAENPFCSKCLHERLATAHKGLTPKFTADGAYYTIITLEHAEPA